MPKNEVERCLQKRFSGGRSIAARVIDYIALRLIVFAGAYLLFASQGFRTPVALALALLVLGLISLLMRIRRELAYARFAHAERARIARQVELDEIVLLPRARLLALCRPLLNAGESAALLVCAAPADENALLNAVRDARAGSVCVFSTAGYTKKAEALACRLDGVRLCDTDALLQQAQAFGSRATPEQVDARIRADLHEQKSRRARSFAFSFPRNAVSKYAFASLMLLACSFFTRYTLYYRILAGLCMSICTVSAALSMREKRNA